MKKYILFHYQCFNKSIENKLKLLENEFKDNIFCAFLNKS